VVENREFIRFILKSINNYKPLGDCRRMVKKLAWMTDIHLSHLEPGGFEKFIDETAKLDINGLLISGDIGESGTTPDYLSVMENSFPFPVYFVLGNHDFYYGSISKVRKEIKNLVKHSDKLFFLDNIDFVRLNNEVALIGHTGWNDGRFGNFMETDNTINDYHLIEELQGLSKEKRFRRLNNLGDEAAEALEKKLNSALKECKKIICLTHVPPYKEVCRYRGKISSYDYLPHYSCKATGYVMKNIMLRNSNADLKIFCGHTHGWWSVKILDNLEVTCGRVEYGNPKVQQIIEID
jgi:predicted phosphohydrolase